MTGKINSAGAAVDALGGTNVVARLFKVRAQVVSNWRERGLPAKTYAVFERALREKGLSAPGSLWGQLDGVERTPAVNRDWLLVASAWSLAELPAGFIRSPRSSPEEDETILRELTLTGPLAAVASVGGIEEPRPGHDVLLKMCDMHPLNAVARVIRRSPELRARFRFENVDEPSIRRALRLLRKERRGRGDTPRTVWSSP